MGWRELQNQGGMEGNDRLMSTYLYTNGEITCCIFLSELRLTALVWDMFLCVCIVACVCVCVTLHLIRQLPAYCAELII